jgi:hypothetical protein
VLLHTGAEAQVELRHAPRQVARQLRPASSKEEVDDREVVWTAARGLERLSSGPRDVNAIALKPKDHGQGSAAPFVGLDEENVTRGSHGLIESNTRTRAERPRFGGKRRVGRRSDSRGGQKQDGVSL